MEHVNHDEIRQHVRNRYKQIAVQESGTSGCCSPITTNNSAMGCCDKASDVSAKLGYSDEELTSVPDGANLGLGCGNPQAIASIKPDEYVLDLGSGGGFDCFLAANQAGEKGRVIGVDMTPEMISRARNNALKNGYANVEFRLGEIEHLPIQDRSIDVIISNCVINLSPDKQQVFNESYRVLKPGGRLAISDIVTTAELPEEIRADIDSLSGCISGATSVRDLYSMLQESGFTNISIEPKDESREFIRDWVPGANIDAYIQSAVIQATKKV